MFGSGTPTAREYYGRFVTQLSPKTDLPQKLRTVFWPVEGSRWNEECIPCCSHNQNVVPHIGYGLDLAPGDLTSEFAITNIRHQAP